MSGTAAPIRLLYFAWLRERMGTAAEQVVVPQGVTTVAELTDWLRRRSPAFEASLAGNRTVRCAVNQTFATGTTPVAAGDEVAFFPPVTGG